MRHHSVIIYVFEKKNAINIKYLRGESRIPTDKATLSRMNFILAERPVAYFKWSTSRPQETKSKLAGCDKKGNSLDSRF